MVVQHNLTAMNANRYLGINNSKLSKSLEKLSSGYAINRAGDNAAGLAVSEKMRSQIAGMTQGVKNAQDGISMIQTFEGALTETDSILQRMKTLADQAANGTYQDDVDRDAIQLEFDQLNDELNQIADTDFNGVIVLNGGQMADGTKAVDGKFDYENAVRDAKQLGSSDINFLDNQKIDQTSADSAWNIWSNSKYDRTATQDKWGPDSIDITFTYDGEGGWKATGCSDANMDLDLINTGVTTGKDTAENNGGFVLSTDGTANDPTKEIANVVVDTSNLKKGDTITLTVKNPAAKNAESMNFGVKSMNNETTGLNFTSATATKSVTAGSADLTKLTWTPATGAGSIQNQYDAAADKDMTEETKALLDALDGAEIKVTYNADGKSGLDQLSIKLKGETYDVSLTDGTDTVLNLNGKSVGKATFTAATAANTAATLKLTDLDGNEIGTFTFAKDAAAGGAAGNVQTVGSVTYKIGNSEAAFDASAKPTVEVKEPDDGLVSKSNTYSNATAPLTYTDNITLQAGARSKDAVNFTFKYTSGGLGDLKANMNCSARADGLGTADLSLKTQESANAAIDKIDNAINKVSMVRATFGAVQNRLEHKIDNMNVSIENLTSAESGIRDTNMPTEMMNFTKQQILAQASQSMLAQANQLPQSVLSLLQ